MKFSFKFFWMLVVEAFIALTVTILASRENYVLVAYLFGYLVVAFIGNAFRYYRRHTQLNSGEVDEWVAIEFPNRRVVHLIWIIFWVIILIWGIVLVLSSVIFVPIILGINIPLRVIIIEGSLIPLSLSMVLFTSEWIYEIRNSPREIKREFKKLLDLLKRQ